MHRFSRPEKRGDIAQFLPVCLDHRKDGSAVLRQAGPLAGTFHECGAHRGGQEPFRSQLVAPRPLLPRFAPRCIPVASVKPRTRPAVPAIREMDLSAAPCVAQPQRSLPDRLSCRPQRRSSIEPGRSASARTGDWRRGRRRRSVAPLCQQQHPPREPGQLSSPQTRRRSVAHRSCCKHVPGASLETCSHLIAALRFRIAPGNPTP
ncbi:hypothetical protein E5CHR_01870 [Variovorax sp. PBL-E5]|nr:hypothetical protein E5CHR_01870 [Variovorax sp. PBL-E5]